MGSHQPSDYPTPKLVLVTQVTNPYRVVLEVQRSHASCVGGGHGGPRLDPPVCVRQVCGTPDAGPWGMECCAASPVNKGQ